MNLNFKKVRLGDVATFINGRAYKSSELLNEGKFRVLRVGNLFTNNKWYFSDLDLNDDKYCSKGDLIYAWSATFGPHIWKGEKVIYHYHIWKIVCDTEFVDKFFLYYLLKDDTKKIKSIYGTGATMLHITKSAIESRDIKIPTLNIQRKIASALLCYDKLIENNTRRIEILEEMAQRIYKEWFIDFKYPGHENDELVDSELGMIPESWELNNLDKYVSFDRGTEPGSKNYQDNKSENTIPFLRVGDLSARNKYIYISKELTKEKILEKKDIVISLDGTVGIVKTGLEGCFSTGLRKCRIINNSINREFLFYTLKSRNIQSTIKAHATGSTILHASSSIKYMKFALPTNEIMNNFFEMINPIISEKQILTDKNYNLSKTRDYLLPKLISGKVDVSDLDIDTSILDE